MCAEILVKKMPHSWLWYDDVKVPAGTNWQWSKDAGISHVTWDRARAKPKDHPSSQLQTRGSLFQPESHPFHTHARTHMHTHTAKKEKLLICLWNAIANTVWYT